MPGKLLNYICFNFRLKLLRRYQRSLVTLANYSTTTIMQSYSTQIPLIRNFDFCVLMPAHNNFIGLVESIKSIAYKKDRYVILIVDDGSKIPVTKTTLYEHFSTAINIEVIRLAHNQGITIALNTGLEYIYNNFSVQFIARLDCGDICTPERFHTQVEYLQSNKNIDLIGSWCYFKNNESGLAYKYITPTEHERIKRSMNFRNVFIHPTVMWRFSASKQLKYPEDYQYAEDYGLFYEMICTMKSAIINQYLVTCEINQTGISIKNRSVQLKSRLKVISFYGKNEVLAFLGAIKLRLMMMIPHQFIFFTKNLIYKV